MGEPERGMALQIRRRERNEWIEQLHDAVHGHLTDSYVCECTDARCDSTISLTRPDYEAIRESGIAFVIATDHEDPRSELVTRQSEGYAVVRTVLSDLATLAHQANPRQA